jgi:hypothetical protein
MRIFTCTVMGTTESILLEQHQGSQVPTIPTSPTKKHVPKRQTKPRIIDPASSGYLSSNQRIPITYRGIILGLPSSGKRTLLKRLEGKDPFHGPSCNNSIDDEDKRFNDNKRTRRILVPYNAPGPTWGERIQLQVEIRGDVPDDLDFGIIMLNPDQDPDQLKIYLLRILSFLLTRQFISICILLNFRDKQSTPQVSEEDVKMWIQDVPMTNLSGSSTYIGLHKTIVTSLKNCYGLASLHTFIYQSYLSRKQQRLEAQLKEVEKASQMIDNINEDVSYEDFVVLLNRSSSNDPLTKSEIPIESSKNPALTPIPRRTFHQNLKINSQQNSKIFSSKRLGNVQTLEEFFADDDDTDEICASQGIGKSSSQTSDDDEDEDDFYYDDMGRRTKISNSFQQECNFHDAKETNTGHGTKNESLENMRKSSLSDFSDVQVINRQSEYCNEENSCVNKVDSCTTFMKDKVKKSNLVGKGLPANSSVDSSIAEPQQSPSTKPNLPKDNIPVRPSSFDINHDHIHEKNDNDIDSHKKHVMKIKVECTSDISNQGSNEGVEQNGWESDDIDLESSEHTIFSETLERTISEASIEIAKGKIEQPSSEHDCNFGLKNAEEELSPVHLTKGKNRKYEITETSRSRASSDGNSFENSDVKLTIDHLQLDIVKEEKISLCKPAVRNDTVSVSEISSSSLIAEKEKQVNQNEMDNSSPSRIGNTDNREENNDLDGSSRHDKFLTHETMPDNEDDDEGSDDDYIIGSTTLRAKVSLDHKDDDDDDEFIIEETSFPIPRDPCIEQISEEIQFPKQKMEEMKQSIENKDSLAVVRSANFQDRALSSAVLAAIQEGERQAKLMLENQPTFESRDNSIRKDKKSKKQKSEKKAKKKPKKNQAF